jgi:hypothetical protein
MPVESVLNKFVCRDVPLVRDALIVPKHLENALVDRVVSIADDNYKTGALFKFLESRASDEVFKKILLLNPLLILRRCYEYSEVGFRPRFRVAARAHSMGILDEVHRQTFSEEIFTLATENFDLSFLDNAALLELLGPALSFKLGFITRATTIPSLSVRIEEITDEADLDEEPETHFTQLKSSFEMLDGFVEVDDETKDIITGLEYEIGDAETKLLQDRADRDEEADQSDTYWGIGSGGRLSSGSHTRLVANEVVLHNRSIFDDLDE